MVRHLFRSISLLCQATVFFCLVACGDDGSSSGPEGGESSSVVDEIESSSSLADEGLSSSEIVSSSSIASSESRILRDAVPITTTMVEDTFELFYYGRVSLNFPADSFLTMYEYGDIVTLMVDGYDTVDVPVVPYTGSVTAGEFLLRTVSGSDYLFFEVLNGNATEAIGIGREIEFPIEVVVQMKEKGGYLEYLELQEYLTIAYELEAYPNFSVEEFANFRMVETTGMGEGVLYRSSSPINPALGRNFYADSLAWVAGVATFVNLAESMGYAETYRNLPASYYATQNVVFLNLPATFVNRAFKDGLVEGFRYIIEHEGPYLVHCTYGMDRTGFTIAVLEALMGATADEIRADYVKSYTNYCSFFGSVYVALPPHQVDLAKEIIVRNLKNSFHTEGVDIRDFDNADLAAAAESYLLALGMEKSEIEALKERLK